MAGRKPKNAPLTKVEITEMVQKKRSPRIYKEVSDESRNESIRQSVKKANYELQQMQNIPKINMDDIVAVRSVVGVYLETCADSATLPTMAGIATILGYTRPGLYLYMAKHDTESSKFLHQVHDKLADIIAENSLKNNLNSIVSIFLLKALFGYRETANLEISSNMPTTNMSVDEIALKAGLLDSDYNPNYKDKYRNLIDE